MESFKTETERIFLTKNILAELFFGNEGSTKSQRTVEGVVQTISHDKDSKFAIISDGFLKEKAVFFKKAQSFLKNNSDLTPLSIINATFILHNNTLIITDASIAYPGKDIKLIGNPISKSDYLENGKNFDKGATNMIEIQTEVKTAHKPRNPSPIAQNAPSNVKDQFDEEDFIDVSKLTLRSKTWTIKVKLESKGDVKTFVSKNKGKKGKVCNAIFFDKSGKIRSTLWTEEVDKYFEKLQPGHTYVISNCDIKPKSKWNNTSTKVELQFNRKSKIIEVVDDEIPDMPMVDNMIDLNQFQAANDKTQFSFVGIIFSDGITSTELRGKGGKPLSKNEFFVIDQHKVKTKCLFWNETLNGKSKDIVQTKGKPVLFVNVLLKEFRGNKSITVTNESKVLTLESKIKIQPDLEKKLKEIRGWYESFDISKNEIKVIENTQEAASAKIFTLEEMKETCEEDFGDYHDVSNSIEDYKSKWFSVVGRVAAYANRNKTWHKNDKTGYFGSMKIADFTGESWVNFSKDTGEVMFGLPAEEFRELELEENNEKISSLTKKATGKSFYFKIVASVNEYNQNRSIRFNVWKMFEQTDDSGYKKMANTLMGQLDRYFKEE